jgi:hypothetical protein
MDLPQRNQAEEPLTFASCPDKEFTIGGYGQGVVGIGKTQI